MRNWTSGVVTGELRADYSQIELHPGDSGHAFDMTDFGLANGEFGSPARLRAGDERYRSGVIRYVQELFRVTYATGVYDDVRDDHERVASLIDQRAAAAP